MENTDKIHECHLIKRRKDHSNLNLTFVQLYTFEKSTVTLRMVGYLNQLAFGNTFYPIFT